MIIRATKTIPGVKKAQQEISFSELASELGYKSTDALRLKVFNLGWKSIWLDAKRRASERGAGAVTDDDLIQAAKALL